MLREQRNLFSHNKFLHLKNMQALGFFMVLRTLAISVFAIFVPIYFYNLGKSSISIFSYFALAYITEASLSYFTTLLYRKIGPRNTLVISVPLLMVYYYLLATIATQNWPLWLLGVSVGVSLAFFWAPYHYLFSRLKHPAKASLEVGIRNIAVAVLSAIGPVVGGFVIFYFGQSALLTISSMILVFGLFFLGTMSHVEVKEKFRLSDLKIKKHGKQIVAYIGYGWEEVVSATIWPLFIFIMIGSIRWVGALTTLTLLSTVAITITIAKLSDGGKRPALIKEGSLLNTITNIFRAFSYTIYHVAVVNVLKSISGSIFSSPFVSEYYLHADEETRDEYIFMMEFSLQVGRVAFFAILILASLFLPIKSVLFVGLILGAIGAMLTSLMPASKKDVKIAKNIKLMPRPVGIKK